jgi:protocatechuate 3,4-dioxygenase beta subunit
MPCCLLAMAALAVVAADPGGPPAAPAPESGLRVGDEVVPWNPVHVAGPDRGTKACPVCTYLGRPAVLIFTKEGANAAALAVRLEKLVGEHRKSELKGFVVVLDGRPERLTKLAADWKIAGVGLCYPDPQTREQDLRSYKIAPAAGNTVLIYKDYKVVATFVDLDAGDWRRVEAAVKKLLP